MWFGLIYFQGILNTLCLNYHFHVPVVGELVLCDFSMFLLLCNADHVITFVFVSHSTLKNRLRKQITDDLKIICFL